LNNSVINIDGIHAESKVFSKSEYSVDWYAVLTIRDEYGNKIEILIDNGKIKDAKNSSDKHK